MKELKERDEMYKEIVKKNKYLELELITIEDRLAKEHYIAMTEEKDKIVILVEEINWLWDELVGWKAVNFGSEEKNQYVQSKIFLTVRSCWRKLKAKRLDEKLEKWRPWKS